MHSRNTLACEWCGRTVIGGGLWVVRSGAAPGLCFLSFYVVGGARRVPPPPPPATPGASETGDPHVLANYMPRPSDCRRRSGISPPAARYRFAGGAMIPSPRVRLRDSEFDCTLAEHCNSPRRRCCCTWCHPVVSTAAGTYSVKPSSPPPRSFSLSTSFPALSLYTLPVHSLSLPAPRHPWHSDFPHELDGSTARACPRF